jgi:hypothetical protein
MKNNRFYALRSLALLGIYYSLTSSQVFAAPPSTPSVQWDSWYTVTALPSTPYAYYRETVETTRGRIHFKTQMWKNEEGYINEEQLGAFALDNELLTPLFYNFHSTYRASEITFDGTATESKLTVRIKKTSEDASEKPVVTRTLPSKTIFSSFFPVWLRKQLQKNSTQGTFLAILEDSEAAGFEPTHGSFKVVQPDEFSKQSDTSKIEVRFTSSTSHWYVDKNGRVARIDMPSQKTRIDRVNEATALAFFDKKKGQTQEKKSTPRNGIQDQR